MKITIITIGKKHEAWVQPGIFRFLERLRAPFAAEMIILPHSSFEGDRARQEESERIFSRLNSDDFVILLDERGKKLIIAGIVEPNNQAYRQAYRLHHRWCLRSYQRLASKNPTSSGRYQT